MNELTVIAATGHTGYGVAAFNICKALDKLGIKVTLLEIGRTERTGEDLSLIKKWSDSSLNPDAPVLKIWHQFDLERPKGLNGLYMAMPIFELDTFNQREIEHLQKPDLLLINSKWAKGIVQKHVDTPVEIVPLGVDVGGIKSLGCNNGPYVFLNVGKWEVRKGHDILVELFNRAFTKNDAVELWLLPHNGFLSKDAQKEWEDYYYDSPLGDKIKIFPWQKTHKEVFEIMLKADCGIFPSRAEGWNLELLEMMAMGKPVITTNYSAHTEFCTPQNACLVDIEELEPAYDGIWFHGNGNWAKIREKEKEAFVSFMQKDYERFNQSGWETGQKFSWINSANEIIKIINRT